VAFSPDGRWLASGSDDGTVRLWDMDNREAEPTILSGHEDWVRSVAFSPDGRWLASGSEDRTVRQYSTLERIWGRPTLDCNGIWGGYVGPGSKTVLPAWARAKLSCRLVPGQNPRTIMTALWQILRDRCPTGVQMEFTEMSTDLPWMMPADSPSLAPALAAMTEAFGTPCRLIRAGGTIPITAMFQQQLGVNPLMMGFGLPDDRHHSPNEKMRLTNYFGGIRAAAALMANLGGR
jgi:acetylornithine deacetylase/succinyl-diaminopimelate desuccinylase-like protein